MWRVWLCFLLLLFWGPLLFLLFALSVGRRSFVGLVRMFFGPLQLLLDSLLLGPPSLFLLPSFFRLVSPLSLPFDEIVDDFFHGGFRADDRCGLWWLTSRHWLWREFVADYFEASGPWLSGLEIGRILRLVFCVLIYDFNSLRVLFA